MRRGHRTAVALGACWSVTLALAACGTSSDSTATTVVPAPTTAASSTTTLPPIDGELRLRPVLAPLPVDGIPLNPIGGDRPDDTVIAPENATGLAYQLGPTAIDGDDVASATSGMVASQWSVTIELTPEGAAAADDLAARCLARDPSCPRGQVAVTVDGFVIAVVVVDQPSFGGELVVTGSLSQAEAETLADVIGVQP